MKKILGILVLCTFILTGCEKFLDEENKGGITNEEFYKTAAGYETLMTASYSSLRTVYRETPWLLFAGTDMYQRPRGTADRSIQEYEQLYPTDGFVRTFYKNCYDGIQIVNMALYYNDLPSIADTKKMQYKAELRFLRAFYHFLLVEQFGGIIINSEPTLAPRMNIPRSSLQASYDFIIAEMEASLTDLTAEKARVNKTTANHYLAKVYLTKGWDLKDNSSFEKAKTYATAAIAGKNITIPFEQLWNPTNENNDEFIFSVQYDQKSLANTTSGNNQQGIFGAYLGGSENGHKWMTGAVYPSWNLHNFYTENDARYDATFMLTVYDKYFDYYDASKDKSKILIRAFYPRVWGREYTKADSLAWAANHQGQIPTLFRYFPFKYNEEAYRAAYELDFSSPVIKKFDSPKTSATFNQMASARDIVLARLAETYFIYAEASIGLNDFATAAQYVQKVLDRPGNAKNGIKLLPNSDIATAGSQSAALDFYLIESAKEFAGEFLRWPELRRTGKLKEFVGKYNYDIKKLGVNNAFKGVDGQDKIYRPIPQDAINLNEAEVPQNPGYSN
jgi:starch-binding outer membrane protein, SusD/RagB family